MFYDQGCFGRVELGDLPSDVARRLTEVVRVREGLAYSVYSMVTRKVDLGLWQASVQALAI